MDTGRSQFQPFPYPGPFPGPFPHTVLSPISDSSPPDTYVPVSH